MCIRCLAIHTLSAQPFHSRPDHSQPSPSSKRFSLNHCLHIPIFLRSPGFVVSPSLAVTPTSTISSGSSSQSHTASALPAITSSRKSNTPAIAGGVIGGAVVAIAVVLLLLRRGRKTTSPAVIPFDPPETSAGTPYAPAWTSEAIMSANASLRRKSPPSIIHDPAETIVSMTSSQASVSPVASGKHASWCFPRPTVIQGFLPDDQDLHPLH